MIFVTVGDQMPFDRLVRAVDAWAAATGHRNVFAQVGVTAHHPRHLRWAAQLDPVEHRRLMFQADLIVAHAGMGTILTALELGRPIIVLPRRGHLRETRNDHQLGTARALAEAGWLAVADDENDLVRRLADPASLPRAPRLPSHASVELLTTLRAFIRPGALPVTDTLAPPLPWPMPEPAPTIEIRRRDAA